MPPKSKKWKLVSDITPRSGLWQDNCWFIYEEHPDYPVFRVTIVAVEDADGKRKNIPAAKRQRPWYEVEGDPGTTFDTLAEVTRFFR